MTARERRVRELVSEAMYSRFIEPAKAFREGLMYHNGLKYGARYVAEKLLDEIDALTKKSNAAIKLAAKGRK